MTITRRRSTPWNDPFYVRPATECVMCDSPAVVTSYPAPMCSICHAEWAE